jgi:two-component system nitrogen regulation response regulator NtrX
MSLPAQAKVLRALEENRITRVGGEKEIPVNVRMIAATNKNIREEIEKKNFREDLYHRLSVILIDIPPLSKRTEDIPMLADHFLTEYSASQGKPKLKFSPGALEALKKIKWTGNVRELRNVIERLVILCEETVTEEDIRKYSMPIW